LTTFSWDDFVGVLKNTDIEFHHLKLVQLAQAIWNQGAAAPTYSDCTATRLG